MHSLIFICIGGQENGRRVLLTTFYIDLLFYYNVIAFQKDGQHFNWTRSLDQLNTFPCFYKV